MNSPVRPLLTFRALIVAALVAATAGVMAAQSSVAPPASPRQFVISHWNLDEGLPQSSVNAVLQTRDGYLWLATFGGLARFDGVRFTVFDRSNTPALLSDRCINLSEDRRGRLWIGTEGGVALLDGGEFRFFGRADGLSTELVNGAFEDPTGAVWVATGDRRLHRFDGRGFDPSASVPLGDRNAIRQVESGGLVATNENIRLFDGTTFREIHRFRQRLTTNVRSVLMGRDSAIWVTTNGSGLLRVKHGREQWYTQTHGISDLHLASITEADDGALWIGSPQGLVYFHNGHGRLFTTADGMSDQDIRSLCIDREKNVWIGTSTGGVNRMRRALVSVYGKAQGLREEKILSVAVRRDGSLLFGSNCGGLHEWRNGRASDSPLSRFLVNECIWTVFEDRSGTIWIGSDELQAVRNDRLVMTQAIPSPYATFEDRSGRLWVGTAEGLFRREANGFQRHPWSDRLPHRDVRTIFEDREGALWIGTVNGFGRFIGDSIAVYTDLPGLASHYIRAIHQDADGVLWFGSYGGGIVRSRRGEFRVLTTRHGLFDNIVSHLIEDREGYFWTGSNRGLSRVSRAELNDVADGRREFVTPVTLGRSDGLVSVETNGGFQPSAAVLADGRIAFPTVQGLAIVDPARLHTQTEPPPVIVEAVIANGHTLDASSVASIAHDDANLEIRYTALSLSEPTKVRFRYRLEGYDEQWIDAEGRRSAFYTKVSPGTHVFHVIASNHHGVWNSEGARLTLTIVPPFWMTWWFISGAILFFLSVGPAIYIYRVSALKREREAQRDFSRRLLESQEAERRRIAAELHDGLGQNLLIAKNRAAMALQDPSDHEQLVAQLRMISEGASSMIGEARAIAHNLRPAHLERFGLTDTLQSTIDQVAGSTTLKWTHAIDNVDGVFSKDDEMIVFRIVQEAMNNVLKHSKANEAGVTVSVREHDVTIDVRDDGIGFVNDGRRAAGLGLTGIEERSKLLGGTCTIRTAPGAGSVVIVVLPRTQSNHD